MKPHRWMPAAGRQRREALGQLLDRELHVRGAVREGTMQSIAKPALRSSAEVAQVEWIASHVAAQPATHRLVVSRDRRAGSNIELTAALDHARGPSVGRRGGFVPRTHRAGGGASLRALADPRSRRAGLTAGGDRHGREDRRDGRAQLGEHPPKISATRRRQRPKGRLVSRVHPVEHQRVDVDVGLEGRVDPVDRADRTTAHRPDDPRAGRCPTEPGEHRRDAGPCDPGPESWVSDEPRLRRGTQREHPVSNGDPRQQPLDAIGATSHGHSQHSPEVTARASQVHRRQARRSAGHRGHRFPQLVGWIVDERREPELNECVVGHDDLRSERRADAAIERFHGLGELSLVRSTRMARGWAGRWPIGGPPWCSGWSSSMFLSPLRRFRQTSFDTCRGGTHQGSVIWKTSVISKY